MFLSRTPPVANCGGVAMTTESMGLLSNVFGIPSCRECPPAWGSPCNERWPTDAVEQRSVRRDLPAVDFCGGTLRVILA